MSSTEHDLVIIGAGPGGYVAAICAAQLGLNLACLQKEPVLGGTCLRVGCIPSKALLESSERFYAAKEESQKHGILFEKLGVDLERMLKRKDDVVMMLTKGIESLLKKNKIPRYVGTGRI